MSSSSKIKWSSDVVEVEEDIDAFQAQAIELGWSDGLPLIPPTPERVEQMLTGTDRDPQLVIGTFPPSNYDCTVEKVAIAGVMAGCLPTYVPVLIAIIEASLLEKFNMVTVQSTTHPCGILAMVNGPIARSVGLNARFNALGPGCRANSTIGRAVRLVQQNVGGAYPGTTDLSTQGSPLKIGICFAENEEESPWEPFHVAQGFGLTESVVTIQAAEAPREINDHVNKDAKGILVGFADAIAIGGTNAPYGPNHEIMVGVGPEHAAILASDGVTRADVQTFLFERARIPYRVYRRGGQYGTKDPSRWLKWADENAMVPMCSSPERIGVYVVGGKGKHSIWTGQGGSTARVSKRVELADGSPWMPEGVN